MIFLIEAILFEGLDDHKWDRITGANVGIIPVKYQSTVSAYRECHIISIHIAESLVALSQMLVEMEQIFDLHSDHKLSSRRIAIEFIPFLQFI